MLLLNDYLRNKYGCKVYKIALNGGFTCPNRDGTIGTGGCIFCSEGGSGEFAPDARLSITEQIEEGKKRLQNKISDGKYIAYFQAYTGTYAPIEKLRALFMEAISHPEVVILSIATRPDCLPDDVVIHRLTGDGDKKLLVAPLWSADKKHAWNRIKKEVLTNKNNR